MFTSRHAQLKLTTFDVRPRGAAGGYFALFYGYTRMFERMLAHPNIKEMFNAVSSMRRSTTTPTRP